MLMNKKMLHAITPDSIILTEHYKSKCIPLHDQQAAQIQPNFISVVSNVRLPADTKKEINISMALPCQNSVIGMADKLQTEMQLHSLNAHHYTLSHPHINAAGQLTCVLQNNSLDDLHFDGQTVIATAEPNATSMHSQESSEEDSLDDQIIDENTLFDPTALDKKFSYKDCEINPNLAPTITSQLKALLKECKAAFATSKLDVGKFKEFTVQLEIDQEIQPEKQ
jgi:hypothetical protein